MIGRWWQVISEEGPVCGHASKDSAEACASDYNEFTGTSAFFAREILYRLEGGHFSGHFQVPPRGEASL